MHMYGNDYDLKQRSILVQFKTVYLGWGGGGGGYMFRITKRNEL